MRQLGPLRRHEIDCLNCPQGDHIFVGSSVPHDAHRFDRQKNGECLRGLLVPSGCAQLIDENRIGASQEICVFPFHFSEYPHAQARTREWMPEHYVMRQPEGEAELLTSS